MGHSESWQEGGVSVAHDGSGEHITWVTVNHGRGGVSIDHDGSGEHITWVTVNHSRGWCLHEGLA